MIRLIFLRRYALALLVFNLAGCSSWYAVSVESGMQQSPPPGIDFGSLVQIKTLDKRTVKFRVTDITDEGLGGNQGFFLYADMQSLKVDKSIQKEANTAAYIFTALGVIALIALVANADSVAVCSPSPCGTPDP